MGPSLTVNTTSASTGGAVTAARTTGFGGGTDWLRPAHRLAPLRLGEGTVEPTVTGGTGWSFAFRSGVGMASRSS